MKLKKISTFLFVFILSVCCMNSISNAALVNTQGNDAFKQNKIPVGTTGKVMNVTFTFEADRDYDNAWIGLSYTDDVLDDDHPNSVGLNSYPFEASDKTFARRSIGKIKEGQKKYVSISAQVRRDIPEGYYGVQVYVASDKDGGNVSAEEYVNVWIKKSDIKDDKQEVKDVDLVIGENQDTPRAKYPNVLNFSVNLTNKGKITAQDVTAKMVLDKDYNVFPFEINEINYDRHYDKIAYGETVPLEYSFAIRNDTYTGYYPIKLKIEYKESSDGEVKVIETEFFVYIINKDREDKMSDFNPNDRTKARIIVDSYKTIPERILAGDEFELIINMKNASSSVGANNILFTFEPEKVNQTSVFSSEAGSSSIALNNLGANQNKEIRLKFVAKPDIEERAYSISIKEKYDSPAFKNAEEIVNVDIPIYQTPRINIGSIEISPNNISVGDDSNVICPINNTGKVTLYNVKVSFVADSIKENEMYLGNIKPGETGNLDVMLTGKEVTMDEGKVKMLVSYENASGEVSTKEHEIILNVSESIEEDMNYDDNMDNIDNESDQLSKPWYIKILPFIGIIVLIVIVVIVLKRRKRKKSESDIEHEIS